MRICFKISKWKYKKIFFDNKYKWVDLVKGK